MFTVGITGVMGSGKSSVAKLFSMLGVPHYDCDSRAKELMNASELRPKISALLGEGAYDSCSGGMNRAYIAEKIFNDHGLKTELESIVHDALREDMMEWRSTQRSTQRPTTQHPAQYVVVESAILYGSVVEGDMSRIVGVVADEQELLQRVMARDGLNLQQIEARRRAQLSQKEIIQRAHEVIHTAENELLTPKIVALHEKLLNLCAHNTK